MTSHTSPAHAAAAAAYKCTCKCRYKPLARSLLPENNGGGHMETFKFLLKRGTKVCTALNGSSVLMEAVDKNRPEFVEYLLNNSVALGIDVKQRDKEGNNALFYAAAGGNVDLMKTLLHAGCPVEEDVHRRTLLMQASLHGHTDMVTFLVENATLLCLSLHTLDKDGRNALFYCIEGGHLDVLDYMIRNELKPTPDHGGRTNLMQAARTGNLSILEYLLNNLTSLELDVNTIDGRGENALFYAARSKKVDVVVCLLNHGVVMITNVAGVSVLSSSMSEGNDAIVHGVMKYATDVGPAVGGRDAKGRTTLHHCVERGDLELLRRLSPFYQRDEDRDLTGASLLMCACKHFDFMHIIRYLVEELKVNVDQVDSRNRGAIFYAVESANAQATTYLLSFINCVGSDRDGQTPLMVATASGEHFVVDALLKSKFCRDMLNGRDKYGRNEVHYCAIHGYSHLLELLQAYGAHLDKQDTEGKSPIMYACANGRFHILLALLRKGAEVDTVDNLGMNALHHCFGANPSLTCVKILVKFDVDINLIDNSGTSPIMLACRTCAVTQIPIIRYLIDHGADPVEQDKDGKDSFDNCPFDSEYVKSFMREKAEIDESQRLSLLKYREQLISCLEMNSVLRGLLRTRIFTKTLNFEVMKKPATERVDRLLELLCMRGSRAFRAFCQVLKDEGEAELTYGLQKEAYTKEVEIYW